MKKLKYFIPYLILVQALGMSLISGFTFGTVLALCVSAYLINHNDKLEEKRLSDKEIILSEVEAYKKLMSETKTELEAEITALRNNIVDLRMNKVAINEKEKSNPFAGKRF